MNPRMFPIRTHVIQQIGKKTAVSVYTNVFTTSQRGDGEVNLAHIFTNKMLCFVSVAGFSTLTVVP
jgi:hypothetical protein